MLFTQKEGCIMRVNRRIFIGLIGMAILSLAVLIVLQMRLYSESWIVALSAFKNNEWLRNFKQFMITVSGGIFTSTSVTLLTWYAEYLNLRKDKIKDFLSECENVRTMIVKLKYFYYIDDIDNLMDTYIKEYYNHQKDINKLSEMECKKEKSHEDIIRIKALNKSIEPYKAAEQRLLLWYKNNKNKNFCVQDLTNIRTSYVTRVEDIMHQYIQFSGFSRNALDNAYDDIKLLRKKDRDILKCLYEELCGFIKTIQGKAFIFASYYNDPDENKNLWHKTFFIEDAQMNLLYIVNHGNTAYACLIFLYKIDYLMNSVKKIINKQSKVYDIENTYKYIKVIRGGNVYDPDLLANIKSILEDNLPSGIDM